MKLTAQILALLATIAGLIHQQPATINGATLLWLTGAATLIITINHERAKENK